jgi:hypothetical protein
MYWFIPLVFLCKSVKLFSQKQLSLPFTTGSLRAKASDACAVFPISLSPSLGAGITP